MADAQATELQAQLAQAGASGEQQRAELARLQAQLAAAQRELNAEQGKMSILKAQLERLWQAATGMAPGLRLATMGATAEGLRLREEELAAEPEVVAELGRSLKRSEADQMKACLLYTSPSPRDLSTSRMPSSA